MSVNGENTAHSSARVTAWCNASLARPGRPSRWEAIVLERRIDNHGRGRSRTSLGARELSSSTRAYSPSRTYWRASPAWAHTHASVASVATGRWRSSSPRAGSENPNSRSALRSQASRGAYGGGGAYSGARSSQAFLSERARGSSAGRLTRSRSWLKKFISARRAARGWFPRESGGEIGPASSARIAVTKPITAVVKRVSLGPPTGTESSQRREGSV